ncbi:MAG: alpha/beta hydrolase [Patescibacteria group bacterium]|jgi:hypothetical protein
MIKHVTIVPGNGNTDINENWYPYIKRALEESGIEITARNMPDPELAREEIWIPFIEKELKAGINTIAVGHSSGAVAIMRYLETHKLLGAILVGASHTDLGNNSEKLSGYFDSPWNWDTIKKNTKWIVQYASQDDPYIPITEARFIHEKLSTEYYEYVDQGHFGSDIGKTEFPEIVDAVLKKLVVFNQESSH